MRWLSYLPAVHFTYLNLHILTYLNLSRSKKKQNVQSLEVTPLHRRGLQEKSTKIKMCTFLFDANSCFLQKNCPSLFNFNITLSVRPYFCRLARHGTGDAKRFKLKPRSLQFAPEMHSFSTTMSTKNTLNEKYRAFFASGNRRPRVICCVPKCKRMA